MICTNDLKLLRTSQTKSLSLYFSWPFHNFPLVNSLESGEKANFPAFFYFAVLIILFFEDAPYISVKLPLLIVLQHLQQM